MTTLKHEKNNKIEALSAHIKEHFSSDSPEFARNVRDCARFSNLDNECRTILLEKVQFNTISEIPPCTKYTFPSLVKFLRNDNICFGYGDLEILKVNINKLICYEPEHFTSLHPVRYDKVKETISLGEINMPLVFICDDNFPRVEDGRHRTIALHKSGFNSMDILVRKEELNTIKDMLK